MELQGWIILLMVICCAHPFRAGSSTSCSALVFFGVFTPSLLLQDMF